MGRLRNLCGLFFSGRKKRVYFLFLCQGEGSILLHFIVSFLFCFCFFVFLFVVVVVVKKQTNSDAAFSEQCNVLAQAPVSREKPEIDNKRTIKLQNDI